MSSDTASPPIAPHISSAHDTSNSSESPTLQPLSSLQDAIKQYEKDIGTSLIENQFAVRLRSCDTIESITEALEEQAHDLSGFVMITSIRRMARVLCTVFLGPGTPLGGLGGLGAIQVGHDIGSVYLQPVKLVFSALGILLVTVKDVDASYDVLLKLFESLGNFIQRFDIHTETLPTMVISRLIVKIIVELLSTLAQVTKYLLKVSEEDEVEATLKKLDIFTQDEARAIGANTEKRQLFANVVTGDRMRQDLQRWLSPPDPSINHNIACDACHDRTATWFIQGDTFTEWKSSGSLLWVCGKPGAGKTILCSTIIENINSMLKSGLASLAFFYCDFRAEEKKDRRGLLSSLVFQLGDQSDSYSRILSDLYSEHGYGSQGPSDASLEQCLKDILRSPGEPPIYVIVDALDECPGAYGTPSPRGRVLMLMEELVDLQLPNLHICVTARPEADIETVLNPLKSHSVSLHDEEGQKKDITEYIRLVVNSDPGMGRWRMEDQELVIETLSQKGDGMFRWVSCQFDFLRFCPPASIRRALEELPETLDETYERILQDIDEEKWEFSHRLFQCIMVASRPFLVEELAEFLVFDFKAGQIPTLVEDWRPEDPIQAVRTTCSSLITIADVNGSRVVQLSHFSVKEFLLSSRLAAQVPSIRRYHVPVTPAHTMVAQACLGTLLHLDENVTSDSLKNFPLAEYALEHWMDHAQFDNVSLTLKDGIQLLFDPEKSHVKVWVRLFDLDSLLSGPLDGPSQPPETPLHFAALLGMCDVAQFLIIERSQDVNARRSFDNRTPLFIASERGHDTLVQILLQHGAAANDHDLNGSTPLHLASERGHLEVSRSLLIHGADSSSRDNLNSTPLHSASLYGHPKVAEVLLEHGARANPRDYISQTPLHLASEHVSQLLLDRGADVNARDKDGTTPLHLAAQTGNVKMVQLLLSCGADPNTRAKDDQTALHLSFKYMRCLAKSSLPHMEIAEALLKCGADVNAQDKNGQMPLHLSIAKGYPDVAQLLLDFGAEATFMDKDGTTPLHLASQAGYVKIVQPLLSRGANADAYDKSRRTPLHLASEKGHIDVAELLLPRGAYVKARDKDSAIPLLLTPEKRDMKAVLNFHRSADPNAKDKNRQTPLHLSSGQGFMDIVQFLLSCGANASALDRDSKTPLHLASQNGHLKVVQILCYRADPNAHDRNAQTPLHLASGQGFLNVARFLLSCGADPKARDKNKMTPLHLAWEGEHLKVAELLVSYDGGHGNLVKDGQTALHIAVQTSRRSDMSPSYFKLGRERLQVVEALLKDDADANVLDKNGRTPLHLVSERGYVDGARILLNSGADTKSRDKDNMTPLHLALQNGHLEVAKLLSSYPVDPNTHGKDGQTALHLAVQIPRRYMFLSTFKFGRGYLQVAEVLLKYGADVNSSDKNSRTPLHLVSEQGNLDGAQFLLDSGADAKAQDKDNMTPLHLALKNGHLKVVQLLMKCGVDPDIRGKDDQTALHLAVQVPRRSVRFLCNFKSAREYLQLAEALLKGGADVNASDKHGRTPLHVVSEHGYLDGAQFLLDSGADVKAQDKENMTPLHLALQSGHPKVVRLLLKCGVDPNIRGKDDQTALHLAVQFPRRNGVFLSVFELTQEHLQVARALLKGGADVNACDKNRRTPLHLVSEQGYLQGVQLLLDSGADVKARDKDNMTPLHLALQTGYLKVVRLLLDCGTGPDTRGKDDQPALHLALKNACRYGRSSESKSDGMSSFFSKLEQKHLNIAEALLEFGADPNARDKDGQTLLHLTSEHGYLNGAQLLLNWGVDPNIRGRGNQTALHLALVNAPHCVMCSLSPMKIAEALFKRGADANAQDENGQTPLHLVSEQGYSNAAQLLLDHGADLKATDRYNLTPLHLAAKNGCAKIVQPLSWSADINASDKSGQAPLHQSSKHEYPEVCKLLLDRGADANARDQDNMTSLHWASQSGDLKIVQLLLGYGADPDIREKDEQTALHLALRNTRRSVVFSLSLMQVVEALLNCGVEVDSRDKNNQTPLHLSSAHGYLKAVRLLLDYGADANAQDKDDITPLHLASKSGRMQTVQLLLDRGADAKARDKDDKTPLDLAPENGPSKIIQLLSNGVRDGDDKTGGELSRPEEACGQPMECAPVDADFSDGAVITAVEPYNI